MSKRKVTVTITERNLRPDLFYLQRKSRGVD